MRVRGLGLGRVLRLSRIAMCRQRLCQQSRRSFRWIRQIGHLLGCCTMSLVLGGCSASVSVAEILHAMAPSSGLWARVSACACYAAPFAGYRSLDRLPITEGNTTHVSKWSLGHHPELDRGRGGPWGCLVYDCPCRKRAELIARYWRRRWPSRWVAVHQLQ